MTKTTPLRIGKAPLTAALLLGKAMERAEKRRRSEPPELGAYVDFLWRLRTGEIMDLAALLLIGRGEAHALADARRQLRRMPLANRHAYVAIVLAAMPGALYLEIGAQQVGAL